MKTIDKNTTPMLEIARSYVKNGLSVIPLRFKDKKPSIESWAEYQKRPPTEEELKVWFDNGTPQNIGIVTGRVSGIAVLDFDTPEAIEIARRNGMPVCPIAKTGKGYHGYFLYQDGIRNFQKRVDLPGIDLRGQGGYVVAPGSVHSTGERYKWVKGRQLGEVELAPLPDWVLPLKPENKQPIKNLYLGVDKGNRNNALTQLVGSWVNDGGSIEDILGQALLWNEGNNSPLPRKEIETTVKSIFEKHQREAPAWEPKIEKWPVLDSKALYGFAGKFVELACRNSEADPAAVLATFLARFGIEAGDKSFLWVGDTKHYARIFAVVVGASAKSRKGTSSKPVQRLFLLNDSFPISERLYKTANTSPGPFSSGEGVVFAVRDEIKEWSFDKKAGRGEFIVKDPGIEDKRLFVLDEEFGGILTCARRDGNTLSTILRTAWDSGNIDPLTKNSKIKATGAHIGWVSHIVRQELERKLSEVESFNGFANRVLWVCAKRQYEVALPKPMPENELRKLQGELLDILSMTKNATPILLSPAAETKWVEVYPELSKDYPGLTGCVINRGEAQTLRLAMIYCLLDGKTIITPDHLGAAQAFWTYCRESAQYIFHGREEDNATRKIIEALETAPQTGSELYKLFGNHISKNRLENLLQDLISSNKITSEKIQTDGRSRSIYSLKTSREVIEL